MKIRWKVINGLDDYYISDHGRVYSMKSEKILALSKIDNRHRYYSVNLCKDGKSKHYLIHRLVAEAFVPRIEGLDEINHIDHNCTNNYYENLEWCTHQYNMVHSFKYCSNIRNFRPCSLVNPEGKLVKEFNSISDACRYGKTIGLSYSSLGKYFTSNGYKIILNKGATTIP